MRSRAVAVIAVIIRVTSWVISDGGGALETKFRTC
jgi:hypothetical protein